MTELQLKPAFVDGDAGRIFVLLNCPAGARKCAVFIPAFAEEMNKCRRQISEISMALAARGYASLLIDLSGTGDSDGSFADAQWETWIKDIGNALAWAHGRELAIDALIASRLGCALAASGLKNAGHAVERTVFLQPVESGRLFMTQFLRLRVAASMMDDGPRESAAILRERLSAGEVLEIAGYLLSRSLWQSIERLELSKLLDPCLGGIDVVEISKTISNELSVRGERVLSAAQALGVHAVGHKIAGDPYWMTTEIVVNPSLTQLVVQILTSNSSQ